MSSGKNARFRTAIKYSDSVIKFGDMASGKPGEDMTFRVKMNEFEMHLRRRPEIRFQLADSPFKFTVKNSGRRGSFRSCGAILVRHLLCMTSSALICSL